MWVMGFTEKTTTFAEPSWDTWLVKEGGFRDSPHTSSHHSHRNSTFHMQMKHLTPHHPGFYDKFIQNIHNVQGQIWWSAERSRQKRSLWSVSVFFSKINTCLFLDYGQGAYNVAKNVNNTGVKAAKEMYSKTFLFLNEVFTETVDVT